jgi:hypothetical protein
MGYVNEEGKPVDAAPPAVLAVGDWVTFPVGRGRAKGCITKIDGDMAELQTVTLIKTDAP